MDTFLNKPLRQLDPPELTLFMQLCMLAERGDATDYHRLHEGAMRGGDTAAERAYPYLEKLCSVAGVKVHPTVKLWIAIESNGDADVLKLWAWTFTHMVMSGHRTDILVWASDFREGYPHIDTIEALRPQSKLLDDPTVWAERRRARQAH